MLEMFAPYMLFISFLLTVLFNLWLISKNVHWIVILIANLLLILVMEFFNLAEYNFLNKVIDLLINFLSSVFKGILDFIGDMFSGMWNFIRGIIKDILDSILPWR